ncbi:MAG: hypothetical protein R3D33_04230 [Hyphomicrobiaceae bacterium]
MRRQVTPVALALLALLALPPASHLAAEEATAPATASSATSGSGGSTTADDSAAGAASGASGTTDGATTGESAASSGEAAGEVTSSGATGGEAAAPTVSTSTTPATDASGDASKGASDSAGSSSTAASGTTGSDATAGGEAAVTTTGTGTAETGATETGGTSASGTSTGATGTAAGSTGADSTGATNGDAAGSSAAGSGAAATTGDAAASDATTSATGGATAATAGSSSTDTDTSDTGSTDAATSGSSATAPATASTTSTGSDSAGATAPETAEATATADPYPHSKAERLSVATWGGAFGEAQRLAVLDPFTAASGIAVDVTEHGAAPMVASGAEQGFDVADLPAGVAAKACADGLLLPIDRSALDAAAGDVAVGDFLPGAIDTCSVASVAWSSVVVVDPGQFKKDAPKSLADLFDTKRFPGKRAFPKGPRYVLEMALMADGVPAAEVYQTLATAAGEARALAKLDAIRDSIVWWSAPDEPLKLIADQTVVAAVAFNGRAFVEIAGGLKPYQVIWDGQIYDLDVWAIARSTRHREDALKFVATATRPDSLAALARWFPYGPMRRSAVAMVGAHATLGIEMAPYLPTTDVNFATALRLDEAFWASHEAALAKRLDDWRAGAAASGGSGEAGSGNSG